MLWKKISIFLTSILCSGAFAAFIQTPIPPSFNKNYFQDTNADGKMDRVVFQFLGGITPEYIDGMIDSIVVFWIDSSFQKTSFTILPNSLKIDSSYNRVVSYDFPSPTPTLAFLTSLNDFTYGNYGTAILYQHNGEAIPISMKEKMAPVIKKTFFKSYQERGDDTLMITFSEASYENHECAFVLEYKSTSYNTISEWHYSSLYWNALHNVAFFVSEQDFFIEEDLKPRDSIRVKSNCIMDSLMNPISAVTSFIPLDGSFPIEVYTVNQASFSAKEQRKDRPTFNLEFLPLGSNYPNDTAVGIALDVGGSQFETLILDELHLRYSSKNEDEIDLSKVKINLKMTIFSNLGAYVASDDFAFSGSDSRLENDGKRVFLHWNFLSDNGRFVQTGVYLVDVDVRISYDGYLVYQTKENESKVQSWGILRR